MTKRGPASGSDGAPKKSRSEILLERYKAAGYEPNHDQENARFKFVVSPTTTIDVGSDVSKLTVDFQRGVFGRIKDKAFASALAGVVLFPKIMNPAIVPPWPDSITHKRKDKFFFVSTTILFHRWASTSYNERIDVLADNLIESLAKIPTKHLAIEDRLMLYEAIQETQAAMKLRLVR